MSETEQTHCGFVAIVGAPNVGKSTLLNRMVGSKVSIVSPKVQTTRSRVLGICLVEGAQVVFIDTPGIFQPKRRLDRAMVAAAWGGVSDADRTVLMVDATRGLDTNTANILDRLSDGPKTVILAINKVDLVQKEKLLILVAQLNEKVTFEKTFLVSAETGDGVADLLSYLGGLMPEGPWHFPEDQMSDLPLRLLAAEITREKVFLQLHQELPYAVAVETESWEEKPDGSARIEQTIYVERDSQKMIVLGKGGARIKSIGGDARRDLEDMLERRIHLFLFVKVREKWGDDPDRYRDWGLDFNA